MIKAKSLQPPTESNALQQEIFSPLTRLLRLVKIEEAKLEAYNRAVAYGWSQGY